MDRREFLTLAGGTVVAGLLPNSASASPKPKIKAVAFDAFPILDPRPVFAQAEALFPGRGTELSNLWRTRQFEYTWLRTLTGRYADFWRVTEDALTFAARALNLSLGAGQRGQLMQAYLQIKAYPDAAPALKSLKDAGLRLAFLSNMTDKMLEAGIKNCGLDGLFDHVLSTDRVQAYKPDPRAYQMAVDAFGLKVDEIAFAAFAGWDAAGAKAFGYPTFWVNRANATAEELGLAPDGIGTALGDLVAFVQSWR